MVRHPVTTRVFYMLPLLRLLLMLALLLATAGYLFFFALHVGAMLAYPYPLDYGEGPLLAQVELLRAGTPVWLLYGDPAAPPYFVVNYPPLFPLLAAALAPVTGGPLLAGRLISLLAALGSVAALALLSGPGRYLTTDYDGARQPLLPRSRFHRLRSILLPLFFLTIPVVREWAAYMRVDMLALCLGLWGLVFLRQQPKGSKQRATAIRLLPALAAGLLFVLSLYTKPSLVAAPVAGGLWWLAQSWGHHPPELRLRIAVCAAWALCGGLLLALLQWASGGWFWLHVVDANVNRWDAALAWQFWADQLRLRWPLFGAAAVAVAIKPGTENHDAVQGCFSVLGSRLLALPFLYTLVGALTAVGVGKVGAYANYFLELYAGLIWLVCWAVERWSRGQRAEGRGQRAEGRGQRAEGRGQRAEDKEQRTKNREQRAGELRFLFFCSSVLCSPIRPTAPQPGVVPAAMEQGAATVSGYSGAKPAAFGVWPLWTMERGQ